MNRLADDSHETTSFIFSEKKKKKKKKIGTRMSSATILFSVSSGNMLGNMGNRITQPFYFFTYTKSGLMLDS